jgi:hypothetical protein
MKRAIPWLTLLLLLAARPVVAGDWVLTTSFTDYVKQVNNPPTTYDFGLTGGKYYPYSTPYGRRIGYGLIPQGTADYTNGITPAIAESRLNTELNSVASTLSSYIPTNYPGKTFEALSSDLQEVLVDYGFTEGVTNISAGLFNAVYAPDAWNRIAYDMVYVRKQGGLLQHLKNRAFIARWLTPKGY